jgi:hypothetical protein
VAELFEVAGDPLTLGRSLDQYLGRRLSAEQAVEAVPVGLDSALLELAILGQDADLAGDLVEVDADVVHGWS